MRYLKTYERIFDFLKRKPKETDPKKIEIINLCKEYNITNYTINYDYSVDVDDKVDISHRSLTKIPIKFGKVTGYFTCIGNKLVDLENSPTWVGRNFMCQHQYDDSLVSLKGAPEYVHYRFDCYNNKNLKSFEHMPKHVGATLEFQHTGIYSFDFMCDVTGMNLSDTPLESIVHLTWRYVRERGKFDISFLEVFRYCDPIRPPENEGGKPILILERLISFLTEVNRPKAIASLSNPDSTVRLGIAKYYDVVE